MKIYRGFNEGGNTASPHLVTVTSMYHGRDETVMLAHRVKHSPTGLSWGYAGSGPADLARSILWDYLGEEPSRGAYQAFKAEYVAHWPQDGNWEITSDKVGDWMAEARWRVGPMTVAEVTSPTYDPGDLDA